MYTTTIVEAALREYQSLTSLLMLTGDQDTKNLKLDVDAGLRKLQKQNKTLYETLIGVFVLGNAIQEQAEQMSTSTRQVSRRLHDGVYMLTMLMNGGA
jgi:hypothetical protein